MADKLAKAEWAEYRLGDLFDPIKRGDIFKQKELIAKSDGVAFIAQNESDNGFVDLVDAENYRQFAGGAIVVGRQTGAVYYQPETFVTTDGVLVLQSDILKKRSVGMAIVSAIRKNMFRFSYTNTVSAAKLSDINIKLPVVNGEIDFEFMESFVAELEAQRVAELEAHLTITGLKDYTLTPEEEQAIANLDNVEWQVFNLEKLFGKSTRGRRLKSDDRIPGDLPFVTAGEAETGISAFIGNNVAVFSKNTTTIDMFGSAKYRNYDYGGDDHVAVVHTENLNKLASIFVTSAIHKASYTDKFSYSRNFYAKDANELNISLPAKNNQPDFELMETLISAVQKIVIKDVVLYADERIAATKRVIGKES